MTQPPVVSMQDGTRRRSAGRRSGTRRGAGAAQRVGSVPRGSQRLSRRRTVRSGRRPSGMGGVDQGADGRRRTAGRRSGTTDRTGPRDRSTTCAPCTPHGHEPQSWKYADALRLDRIWPNGSFGPILVGAPLGRLAGWPGRPYRSPSRLPPGTSVTEPPGPPGSGPDATDPRPSPQAPGPAPGDRRRIDASSPAGWCSRALSTHCGKPVDNVA